MSLILNIDTASDRASVSISHHAPRVNLVAKEHSAWLHPAISAVVAEAGVALTEIDAIAVNGGPGSYTGIRVGMSAAKGLAFALAKPLIVIGSLEVMAWQALEQYKWLEQEENAILCPMIDARREEVYTAMFSNTGKVLMEPIAVVTNQNFLNSQFADHQIFYFGNGAEKLRKFRQFPANQILSLEINDLTFAKLSLKKSAEEQAASVFDAQPIYVKDIYTTSINTQTP
jgi:tRNA threonylcarbamoyladenosine biosynthesis protein TsaB